MLCLAFLVTPHVEVKAQGESPWAPDQRIPGYMDDTYTPVLVADNNGNVHAFASQSADGSGVIGIVYRRWSLNGGWTSPVDILLPAAGNAIIQSAFLDADGIFHLVYFNDNFKRSDIYYSHAPLAFADSSKAWSEPIVIGDSAIQPSYAVLSGDGAGKLIMIYTGNLNGNGVYSVFSSDSGTAWSGSEAIYLVDALNLVPFSLRLYSGQAGKIHAAWSVVNSVGGDISLEYARFDLGTDEWTPAETLSEKLEGLDDFFGPSFPSLVDNGSEVIVMYNNGNPLPSQRAGLGRPVQMVRVSDDNGDTWKPATVPFINLEGRSGEHIVVQDGDHTVHALFVQRTAGDAEVLGGIWQSEYRNGFWSDPSRFIPTWPAHDLHAAVSQGNVLLLVWRVDPGNGKFGIWFTYKVLDSQALPLQPYPTSVVAPPTTPTLALLPTVPPTSLPQILLEKPLLETSNPGSAFGVSIIFVAVILIAVVLIFGVSKNRQ